MAESIVRPIAASRWERLPIRDFAYFSLSVMLTLDALEGYTIAGLPLPWIGMALAIPVLLVLAAHQRMRAPPGTLLYLVLTLWLIGNTAISSMLGPYADMHPSTATTSYAVFVLLRGYSFIGYLLLTIVIYNFALTDERQRLVEFIVWLGVVVTLYAFYVYFAQRFGLPVPPKTRYGTAEAGAQAGGDTGHFGDGNERYLVRVTGSFREPSFLAVWLLVPFLFSLTRGRSLLNWRTMVLLVGIMGTGSLTTAVTLPVAFLLAIVLLNPFRRQSLIILLSIGGGIAAFVLLADWASHVYFQQKEGFGFLSQFSERLDRIATGGVGASNRAYAYEKLYDSEFSLVGIGLGNAHIFYSRGALTPVSFLSLYIHVWFAGGAIGVALLALYLLSPIALVMLRRIRRPETVWFVACHVAWLIVYFGTAESFSMMPAVSAGVLLAHLKQRPVDSG